VLIGLVVSLEGAPRLSSELVDWNPDSCPATIKDYQLFSRDAPDIRPDYPGFF
jgi:hypothetical protein